MRTPIITPTQGLTARDAPMQDQQSLTAVRDASGVLERGVSSAIQSYEENQERKARVWAARAFADAKLQWTKEQIKREEEAEGEASGFAKSISEDFQSFQSEMIQKAPPSVRDELAVSLTGLATNLQSRSMAFEAVRRVSYRLDQVQETVDIERNLLLSNPSAFSSSLENVTKAIEAAGLPGDKKQEALRMAKEGLALSSLQSLVDQNPSGTLSDLKAGKWDPYLDPDRKAALMNAAQSELKRRASEARAARNLAKRTYLVGFEDSLAYARKNGALPPETPYTEKGAISILGEEDGKVLWRKMQAAVEQGQFYSDLKDKTPDEIAEGIKPLRERAGDLTDFRDDDQALRQAEAAAFDASRQTIEDEIAAVASGAIEIGQATIINDPKKMAEMFGPDAAEEISKLAERATSDGDFRALLKSGDTKAISEELERLEPSGSKDYRAARQSATAAARAAEEVITQRLKDPVAFSVGANDTIKGLADAASAAEGENVKQAHDRYANALISYQNQIGIPDHQVGLLTSAQASQIVATLNRATSGDTTNEASAASKLNAILETWGDHSPIVLRQLKAAGLPNALYHAFLVNDVDPAVSQQIIDRDRARKDLEGILPSGQKSKIEEAVKQRTSDFFAAFTAGGGASAVSEASGLIDAVQTWAIGEVALGKAPEVAAREGVDRIINQKYSVRNDGRFRAVLPAGVPDRFYDNAMSRVNSKDLRKFFPEPIRDGTGDELRNLETTIAYALSSGVWVTNELGDGLILTIPVNGIYIPLRNHSNKFYEIKIGD